MNISASQLSSSITSVSNSNSVTKQLFQNSNIFTGEPTGDSINISDEGMMMSKMMSRMKSIDPTQMAAKIDEAKSQIESLDLDSLDLDSMSREELESVMSEIQGIMSALKPEGAEGRDFNLADKSDDELRDMITNFSDKSKQMQSGMGRLKEMGGMMDMMAQNELLDMFQMPEETSDNDLIDMLLSALESDDEDEDGSYFNTAIADYFSGITL